MVMQGNGHPFDQGRKQFTKPTGRTKGGPFREYQSIDVSQPMQPYATGPSPSRPPTHPGLQTGQAKAPPFYGQASDYSQAGLRSALGIQIDPATGEAGGIHPAFGQTHSSRLNPETGQWEEVPYDVAYSTTPGWRPSEGVVPLPDPAAVGRGRPPGIPGMPSTAPDIGAMQGWQPPPYAYSRGQQRSPYERMFQQESYNRDLSSGIGGSPYFLPGTTALANQANSRFRRRQPPQQAIQSDISGYMSNGSYFR